MSPRFAEPSGDANRPMMACGSRFFRAHTIKLRPALKALAPRSSQTERCRSAHAGDRTPPDAARQTATHKPVARSAGPYSSQHTRRPTSIASVDTCGRLFHKMHHNVGVCDPCPDRDHQTQSIAKKGPHQAQGCVRRRSPQGSD